MIYINDARSSKYKILLILLLGGGRGHKWSWGECFPFFPSQREALFLPSLVESRFTLKRFVFNTTALLFNDTLTLLSSQISVKFTECFEMSLVLRPVNVLVYRVKVQWFHFCPDQHLLLCWRRAYQVFGWHSFAWCTRHRRSWRLNQCHYVEGLSVLIVLQDWEQMLRRE